MKFDDLESRMRELEAFHDLRVLPGAWTVLRIDGRGFSRFTKDRFEKPFDPRFREAMLVASERLFTELGALYVYSESDEISVLLPRNHSLFDREIEKLVSISAGVASSVLTLQFQVECHCDSRVWVGPRSRQVLDYFRWRQTDATRCCLNGWCYWKLRQAGKSAKEATAELKGRSFSWKNEMLFNLGINFNDLPLWQRRGTGIYAQTYVKEGVNPLTGQRVSATRRRAFRNEELPLGLEYEKILAECMGLAPVSGQASQDDPQELLE